MPKDKEKEMKLPSLDELFSSQKERNEEKLKKIYEIPLDEIDPFPDHPFKVKDDEDMENLVESIRTQGIITPATVRKKTNGRYELVSGHRRMRACELLGIPTLKCEVMDLSKEEATIFMVESNFQRSTILPSEKAFAYKMRLEAMKLYVLRLRQQGVPVGHRFEGMKSRDVIAGAIGESQTQIQRYIRLTELIPELLDLVDEGKIAMRPAVEFSYLEHRQRDVYNMILQEQCTPTHAQTIRMRQMYNEGKLTVEALEAIMLEEKPNQKERIVLRGERFKELFPKNLPVSKREDYVAAAMEHYGRYLKRQEKEHGR